MKTFIHNKIEVVLTGRKATRKGRAKDVELVEIKPYGSESSRTQWVQMNELFEIVEDIDPSVVQLISDIFKRE